MMKKVSLLAATAAVSMASTAFAADNIYAAAELKGNGASSIANVLVQELNCFGGTNNDLGLTTPALKNLPEATYTPTSPTTANPVYDCNTQSIQPNLSGKYVSTGSGGGKTSWKNKTAGGISNNPFVTLGTDTAWTNVQFAFSDSPISGPASTSGTDLATYETAAKPTAGAAIQVPLFVLPVAVAYAPTYGKIRAADGSVQTLAFNLKAPRADGTGGLRLKKTTYCGIFNGTITNFNDPALKADNGGQSLMATNDDATRWNTVGVPIKLVGRKENSGTTNIFTRALNAQCGGTNFSAGGTDALPAGVKSGAEYNKTTGVLSTGTEVAGKFGVADGSDGVAAALGVALADPSATIGDVVLNGRLGYLGADWVAPATINGSTLHSADLQQGTGSTFLAPNAKNAAASFKGILPPQSASTGKYQAVGATGSLPGLRSDPQAWVIPANATTGLANPTAGYPIVGTTQLLTYTCFASPAVRNAVQGFLAFHLGKVAKNSALQPVPAKLVSNTSATSLGILATNGVAPLPAQWATAILETFVTKVSTGNNPGALNLWIQDKTQAKSTDTLSANPTCTAGQGA